MKKQNASFRNFERKMSMKEAILEKIRQDELAYETTLSEIAAKICRNKDIKIILIAGGSCAGKTTTTRKLSELITQGGRKAHTVSLDDYYRNMEESVYLPDGTRDIESVNSLRVDMIRESMTSLLSGKETPIPMFDFKSGARTDDYRRITIKGDDVVLVEGLHALNLTLFEKEPEGEQLFKIYLYAHANDGASCRFIRRLVRDARHRGSDVLEHYQLWDNVKANERESIEPFRQFADVEINTYFPYEHSILNDDAVAHLKQVPAGNPNYDHAQKLISILEPVPQLTDDYVPENSLLREFM